MIVVIGVVVITVVIMVVIGFSLNFGKRGGSIVVIIGLSVVSIIESVKSDIESISFLSTGLVVVLFNYNSITILIVFFFYLIG